MPDERADVAAVSATAAAITTACPKSSPATSGSRRNADSSPTGTSTTRTYQTICSGRYASAARDCASHGSGTVT